MVLEYQNTKQVLTKAFLSDIIFSNDRYTLVILEVSHEGQKRYSDVGVLEHDPEPCFCG